MEVTDHTPGAFCFAELVTSDTELARRFYGELFGWTSLDVPASAGSYSLFQLRDRTVAGLRRIEQGPHRWVPFLKVESVDALTAPRAGTGRHPDRRVQRWIRPRARGNDLRSRRRSGGVERGDVSTRVQSWSMNLARCDGLSC